MEEKKFAVLIDSDNVSPKYLKTIMDEITNLGVPTVKRIYGDWTASDKQSWKGSLLEFALSPVQQYSYTTGKNSTDSAMIIDAMDLLYTADVDGFCIVSSDSDFTKLATRLREAGKIVIGMGEKKTPMPFVRTCSQFKYIDVLSDDKPTKPAAKAAKTKKQPAKEQANQTKRQNKKSAAPKEQPSAPAEAEQPTVKAEPPREPVVETVVADVKDAAESSATPLEEIDAAIRKIIEDSDEESGLIPASRVGSILQNRYPDFDCRNYGCRRMTDLLKLLNVPTVSYNDPNNPVPNAALLYIKVK